MLTARSPGKVGASSSTYWLSSYCEPGTVFLPETVMEMMELIVLIFALFAFPIQKCSPPKYLVNKMEF